MHLNDTIYEDVKAYLVRLPQNEIKIVKTESFNMGKPSFTRVEFEKIGAGSLDLDEVNSNPVRTDNMSA